MNLDSYTKLLDKLGTNAAELGLKFVAALILLWIGLKAIRFVQIAVDRFFQRKAIEKTVSSFLSVVLNMALKIALAISIFGYMGVETTSFAAILASAGLAIGMALQGSLSNFAGGVLIVLFKPFKVGEYIEAQGQGGTVNSILLFNTVLLTPDNKTVFIPNGPLATGNIVNFSRQSYRRVDFLFGIGYGDDIKKAKNILERVANEEVRRLTEHPITVGVSQLGDSSVNLVLRMFVRTDDYWSVYFDTLEKVKTTFDTEGISIPFPQRDVHLYEVKQ